MTLPLFRLPLLVIKLVLETMGFIEILVMTSTSSRTKRIFKNLVTIKNHEMQLLIGKEDFCFTFKRNSYPKFIEQIVLESEKCQPKDVFFLKIGNIGHVPAGFSDATNGALFLSIYWNRNIHHETVLYNALIDLFRTPPLIAIKMNVNDVADETYRSWINCVNEASIAVSIFVILGKCTFSDYSWILKNVKAKNVLSIEAEITDTSDTLGSLNVDFSFKAEKIFVFDGRWVEMKHLESIEARSIVIFKVSFTDVQINTFLKNWKSLKEASNLKKLIIYLEREAATEVVLDEMVVTDEDLMKPDDVLNQWGFEMENGEKCTVVYAEYDSDLFGFEFRVGNYED